MINAPFISSAAATAPAMRSIDRTQRLLAIAQVELGSGRRADLEITLGAGVRTSVAFRQERSHLSAIADANSAVKSRIDGSQAALSTIAASAQALLDTLLQAASDQVQPGVLAQTARQGLGAIVSGLNTTIDGVHLFAGINTGLDPIAEYFAPPVSGARNAVSDAFSAAFGTPQSGPAVAELTPANVQTFVDTAFADLFREPSWGASWSRASDQVISSRISPHDTVATSVSANEQPIRDIVRAFTMIADLGIDAMNPAARKAVVTSATKALAEGLSGVTAMQARLGTTATVITDANDRMSATTRLMDHLLSEQESIDTAEVSNRIATLTRDLEAAYAIVARMHKLSLLDSI